jgi:hypothetical protein
MCGGGPSGRFIQATRFCSASAAIAGASAPPGLWTRSTTLLWSPVGPFPLLCRLLAGPACGRARCSRSAGGGPEACDWLIRWPGSRCCVSGLGGRQISRAPAARPFAGWRSSSPLRSGGAGTTGTGAVRGPTRRPTSPAAACGRDQQGPGQGSPCLPYPVRAGGLGVHDLVSEDSGPFWSPWWLGRACPGCPPVSAADERSGTESRLASPSRAAGVFTTHDRPQEGPQDSPQESACPWGSGYGARRRRGPRWTAPGASAAGSSRASPRCHGTRRRRLVGWREMAGVAGPAYCWNRTSSARGR